MNSFLSYLGGKSKLADKIITRIPEHGCYCEVFSGAAWILFRKEESSVEIINDINPDLATLFRVVKHHLDEVVRYMRWLLVSREEFDRCSRIKSPTFSISPTRRSNFNLLRVEEELSAAHLRLCRVYIENRPYAQVIASHDRPATASGSSQ